MNILLVESNKANVEPIQVALDAYSKEHDDVTLDLCWVSDRQSLIDALVRYVWQAVISDYDLPDMPWPDILSIVHSAHPYLPVVILSSKMDDSYGMDAIGIGVADFVRPIDMHELGHVVVREYIKSDAFIKLMAAHEHIQNGGLTAQWR